MTLCGANMNMMAWNLAVIWNAICIYININGKKAAMCISCSLSLYLSPSLCVRARPNDFKHNQEGKNEFICIVYVSVWRVCVWIWKTFLHIANSNCHTCHIHKDSHSLTHLLSYVAQWVVTLVCVCVWYQRMKKRRNKMSCCHCYCCRCRRRCCWCCCWKVCWAQK